MRSGNLGLEEVLMGDRTVKAGWGQIRVLDLRSLEFILQEVGSPWKILSQPWEAGGTPRCGTSWQGHTLFSWSAQLELGHL